LWTAVFDAHTVDDAVLDDKSCRMVGLFVHVQLAATGSLVPTNAACTMYNGVKFGRWAAEVRWWLAHGVGGACYCCC
jgi:hypothetical protein